MKNAIVLIALALVCVGFMPSNTFYVTGAVYDENGETLAGVNVIEKGTTNGVSTDINGFYSIQVSSSNATLTYTFIGMKTKEVKIKKRKTIDVFLAADQAELQEIVVTGYGSKADRKKQRSSRGKTWMMAEDQSFGAVGATAYASPMEYESAIVHNTEAYSTIHENGFKKVTDNPLSTFSIDVDAASYSNMRRFINNGQMPPKDAVRIEEMINYFGYDYTQPKNDDPFSINTELAVSPWNDEHYIMQVGLQGEKLDMEDLPPSNIVFLLDVSGSMESPNKLPLLKSSLKMLANELRPEDKVSIVVYASATGLVLEPTKGDNKQKIMESLDKLRAGGSTAGGAGLQLAYKVAKENLVEGGNNRVILATDGDFNVGESSDAAMERLIEAKRKEGVFLTVLGFGMGNYKDSKMETLADKGNGNYGYIDTIKEAKKMLVNEFGGTLFTIAKDVKIQIEFNPQFVQGYRLIGYENRMLNAEDFNDDKKDAGELGSGHTVTALYEIIPVGVKSDFIKEVDELKYQNRITTPKSTDLLTVKFRYKEPDGETSKLITEVVENKLTKASNDLNWASAVAGFGMLLRDSEFKGSLTYDKVISMARQAKGEDKFGYRHEFIGLVESVRGFDQ